MVGNSQQFVRSEGFTHCLDEFRIGGGIHFRHSLFTIPRIAIPKVYPVKIIGFNNRFNLRYKIGDLFIREVAESESGSAAFQTEAHLASRFLYRPNIS